MLIRKDETTIRTCISASENGYGREHIQLFTVEYESFKFLPEFNISLDDDS